MSVVDLHPEALLDREIHGQLDAGERERLEAHLARCATCRLERQLRADFALDLSRDSVPPEVAALVESLSRPNAAPLPGPAPPARRRKTRVVILVAAATVTLVAGAFAATETGHRAMAPLFGRAEVSAPYADAPRTGARPATRASALPSPTPSAPELPAPESAASSPAAATANATAPATTATAAPVVASPPPRPSPVAAPEEGPSPLFAAEAEARRRGDTPRMLELHAELAARYPRSHEAQVSRMMVARVLLDRGDTAGALSGFDAYLRAGSGELREDALAGRATALDRLGRTDEGRRAWMALLDQYPNTAYGAHARSRAEAPGGN